MIRLMILMTPCMCLMTGIAISNIFRRGTKGIRHALIGLKEPEGEEGEAEEP